MGTFIVIIVIVAIFIFYSTMKLKRIKRIGRKVKHMMLQNESLGDVYSYLHSEGYTESGARKFLSQICNNPELFD